MLGGGGVITIDNIENMIVNQRERGGWYPKYLMFQNEAYSDDACAFYHSEYNNAQPTLSLIK